MELAFDPDGLQKQVKSNLKNSKTNLTSAKNILSSLDIPNDFKYYKQLKSYPKDLSDLIVKVKNKEKWVNQKINEFKNIENKNKKLIQKNSLPPLTDIATVSSKYLENVSPEDLAKVKAKIKDNEKTKNNSDDADNSDDDSLFEQAGKTIAGGFNIAGGWLFDRGKDIKNTATKVSKSVKSETTKLFNTGAKIGKEVSSVASDAFESAKSFAKSTKTQVTSACKWSYDKVIQPGWKILKSTAASIDNTIIGVTKGLGQFVESLTDLVIMLDTGAFSVATGCYDGISYLISKVNGNEDEWNSKTSMMWKGVMGFVAEDHVDNVFKSYYQDTMAGKWLDNNAYKYFKSDGSVSKVASGIGYIGGIIALSLATGGLGGVATGAGATAGTGGATASAGIATAAGTGKYTAESWAKKRDSSWEGIERFYKRGEISKEQYNSYKMIRSLNDEQWKEIKIDYKNGKISKEEYEQIKQIREMPEDWTTLENGLKGFGYGVANGVWEGIQWYVGGKLAGSVMKGLSATGNSAVRVGVDTAFNALDTPFRATTEAATSGESWEQAWINQGGWESVLTNAGIGLVASGASEIADLSKIRKGMDTLNQPNLTKGLDESTANKVKVSLMEDYVSGKLDFAKMSKTELAKTVKNKINITTSKNTSIISDIFEKYSRDGKYGIDQGLFRDMYCWQAPDGKIISPKQIGLYQSYVNANIPLAKKANTEYFDIKNTLINKYNMTSTDAGKILSALDSVGACSYASVANNIVGHFKDNPSLFEEVFGFPLYKKTANGNLQINDSALLADMYVFINHTDNGGKLLTTDANR